MQAADHERPGLELVVLDLEPTEELQRSADLGGNLQRKQEATRLTHSAFLYFRGETWEKI